MCLQTVNVLDAAHASHLCFSYALYDDVEMWRDNLMVLEQEKILPRYCDNGSFTNTTYGPAWYYILPYETHFVKWTAGYTI